MVQRNPIVTVIGGTGFLGLYVVRRLASLGFRVQVLSRNASLKADGLTVAGNVGQIAVIDCNATDYKKLEKYINNADYVINLVGILFSRGKQNFNALHQNLPGKVAKLCKEAGVKKLIHVSALGAGIAKKSSYAASKLAGERAVLENYPSATILQPSAMFGQEDNFINMFNKIAKLGPFMPLIGGGTTKLQPVYVDDVARAIIACLESDKVSGSVLEIAGPKVYTLRAIEEFIMKTTRRKRILLNIPFPIANLMATVMGLLPKAPLTKDQVTLLTYDNILSGQNGLEELGIKPSPMELIVPSYIN
jgi:NADH dehydrogenase